MKKNILFIFLLLISVLMFADESADTITIVSFNIHYNNDSEYLQDTLKHIVKQNNADIVLLQEVNLKNNEENEKIAMDLLLSKMKDENFKYFTTRAFMGKGYKTTQNNVILYKQKSFDEVKYLNDEYNTQNKKNNDMCISYFNNVQAIRVKKNGNIFFIVNAHISFREKKDNFKNLKKFLEKLDEGNKASIILGGDLNYTTKKIRDGIDKEKFSSNWFIDGPIEEVPDNNPWVTSVKGENPWDHFIFNMEFKNRIKKVKLEQFDNEEFGMRHALEIVEEDGVKIDKNNCMPFEDYVEKVSDHYPICITIKTN